MAFIVAYQMCVVCFFFLHLAQLRRKGDVGDEFLLSSRRRDVGVVAFLSLWISELAQTLSDV